MSANIRFPNINGVTEREQLAQINSYLHQLVQQLNYTVERVETEAVQAATVAATSGGSQDAQSKFNDIKSLIIKSADIVNAYYEQINMKLSGEYVAQSDFGDFSQRTETEIQANSESILQSFQRIQEITNTYLDLATYEREISAYIKTGMLGYDDNGMEVYGIAVGQRTAEDGEETFNQYAWFTSSSLVFFDKNGTKVAWISETSLHITIASIDILRMGGFEEKARPDGSIIRKWKGL